MISMLEMFNSRYTDTQKVKKTRDIGIKWIISLMMELEKDLEDREVVMFVQVV